MNIYILEDDLMQQTRISDIIRELVSEGTFSVRKLEVFSKPHKLLSSINEKGNHQVFLLDIIQICDLSRKTVLISIDIKIN